MFSALIGVVPPMIPDAFIVAPPAFTVRACAPSTAPKRLMFAPAPELAA